MGLTNAYRDYVAQKSFDGTGTLFDNTNAYIGVGDSSAAFAASQTDLQAATNKLRKGMEATYPQRAANVLTLRSLFGTGDANWAWNEWATFNHASTGTMLQRKVESLGTKTSAQSWQLTVTLTLTAA